MCFLGFLQYLEQLAGPIIFYWVACGVNLVSLVEVMHFSFQKFFQIINYRQYLSYICSKNVMPM